jgi:7,8-dihydropterin-6-yl-methyl-4-(beta-D-ribofuranosyl)aminobenzene 5'-phosphate synthase
MHRAWAALALIGCVSCAGLVPKAPTHAEQRLTAAPTTGEPGSTPTADSAYKETEDVMTEDTPSRLSITILYDNNAYTPGLRTPWGFSAWAELNDRCILFDTGGDGDLLLENMRELKLDPQQIDVVVLSHAHGDHTSGLEALLHTGAKPQVYLPPSFSNDYKAYVAGFTEVVEVSPGQEISEGVYTTGEMEGNVPEQALVFAVEHGLVVLTGCAHPGIVQMVERAASMFGKPVYMVLGGFHLGDRSREQVAAIVEAFRAMDVEKVAPCHCTGNRAMQVFREMYGEDFIDAGVGRMFLIEG